MTRTIGNGVRSAQCWRWCAWLFRALGQSGDKVERIPMANPDLPIAAAVVVPDGYDTVYVSGHIPKVANANAAKGSTEMYGDTKTQTVSVLQQIQDVLAAQQLSMADVVMVHVFLVGDPANGGKMDFAAMNAGYSPVLRVKAATEQTGTQHRAGGGAGGSGGPGGDRGHRGAQARGAPDALSGSSSIAVATKSEHKRDLDARCIGAHPSRREDHWTIRAAHF